MNKRFVTESAKPARLTSIVIMVLGIIGSFILAKELGVEYSLGSYSLSAERDWGVTITLFVAGAFASFLQAFIFKLFAEVLEDLCAIRNELDEAKQKLNEK